MLFNVEYEVIISCVKGTNMMFYIEFGELIWYDV